MPGDEDDVGDAMTDLLFRGLSCMVVLFWVVKGGEGVGEDVEDESVQAFVGWTPLDGCS